MTNFVTTRLGLDGPQKDLVRLRRQLLVDRGDDEGPQVTFEKICPLPATLQAIADNGPIELGLVALGRTDIPTTILLPRNADLLLSSPGLQEAGVRTPEQLRAYLEKEDPQQLRNAEKAIAAYEATGYGAAYLWCLAHWGTRWDAQSTYVAREEPGHLEVVFDTPLSPPDAFLAALAKQFPRLRLTAYAFDEGWCFGCEGSYEQGEGSLDEVEATKELYKLVYGEYPDDDTEEEEEEETVSADEAIE